MHRAAIFAVASAASVAGAAFVPLARRAAGARDARGACAARRAAPAMAESLVVTDGTDSFYGSRQVFQALYDYGEYETITAFSTSVSDAKKMCLSRNARYSGLVDVLAFAEGGDAELAATLGGASTWVVVNADEGTLLAQLKAADSAGVKRAFVHLSAASSSSSVDEAALAAAAGSMAFTVMRTGAFAKTGSGGGLLVSDYGTPTCDEIPADDVYRFIAEAMTIDEASGRSFSLCPSADNSMLKQMRMAGCTRRQEVEALLQGKIKAKTPEELAAEATGGGASAAAEKAKDDDPRSEAEKAAEREEELKRLMSGLKEKGEATQLRMQAEELEKKRKREERMEVFASQPQPDDEKPSGGDDIAPDDKPSGSGDDGDEPPAGGEQPDDDGLQPA